ncbi:MAG TPA: aldo/keto reductase [Thermoplasmata archaeon]|nr:aldo/keto reductase [Thermoplasmata archaeon]
MTAVPPRSSLASRVRTNQGVEIPWVGLGVFQTPPGAVTRDAVRAALEVGYRHIDTAKLYGNEADVGAAIRESGVPREEVFVTTKLWYTDHGFEAAQTAARASLERLGLRWIDLYLIHAPRAPSPEDRLASWRALEKLQREGVCRAIGVSNYAIRHLEELRAHESIVPAINQVEMHPFVYDPALLDYCERRGIRLEAYSPLTRGQRLADPVLREVAAAHQRTPAQVLVRWGLEHGIVEIPKSTRRERIAENADVFGFSLTPAELARLDALGGSGRISGWGDTSQIP